ncbi:MAG: hypothetical protein WCH62_00480 [Candidatus Omnitrophota bacterium]
MSIPRTVIIYIPQFILGLFLLLLFSNWVFPFTTDSITYITTAENISQFKGIVFNNYFITHPKHDIRPSFVAPPGYPILIAAFKFIGIDAYKASLIIARSGFLLLPFLFFMVFKRLMPLAVALVASFVCTFMFSIVKCSLFAWSDVPYLCFSLISLIAAFQIIEKKAQVPFLFIFLAGVIVGYSFLIRYVGLTLIVSIGIGFLGSYLLRIFSLKDFIKTACGYLLGILLVILPYFLRNMAVFGRIQPYHQLSFKGPFLATAHVYLQTLAEMIFASPSFEYVVLVFIIGLLIFIMRGTKTLFQNNQECFIYVLILLIYFFLVSVLLVVFMTMYSVPESIDDRYLIQMAWILMGSFVYAVNIALQRLNFFYSVDIKSVTGLLLFTFILAQSFPLVDFYDVQKRIKNLSQKIERYIPLVQRLPADYVVVSNVFEMTYYFSKRNVRMINNYTPYGVWRVLGQTRKYAVFLIKGDEFLSPAWEYLPMWQKPQGYYKVFSDNNVDLFIPLTQIQRK